MNIPSQQQLQEFLSSLTEHWVSDYRTAKALKARHLRSGKITKSDSKEGSGIKVFAFGIDELGNVCAWCADGYKRQFIN